MQATVQQASPSSSTVGYNCLFCGRRVMPTPAQLRELQEGRLLGFGHVGEFVEMSARRPLTREEALAGHCPALGRQPRGAVQMKSALGGYYEPRLSFRCSGCGDRVSLSLACSACGKCEDCCQCKRR